ncbi:MAG TPA: hypothetical protein DIT96_17725, partial [Pseudomonas sp.]|nr:hypothetical protein [Pseudomonas sp.]
MIEQGQGKDDDVGEDPKGWKLEAPLDDRETLGARRVGVVEVPDERLDKLTELVVPNRTVPT